MHWNVQVPCRGNSCGSLLANHQRVRIWAQCCQSFQIFRHSCKKQIPWCLNSGLFFFLNMMQDKQHLWAKFSPLASQLTIAATHLKSQLGSFYPLINLQFTCLSIDPNVSRGGLNNLDQHIFIFVSYLPMLLSFCDKKQFAYLPWLWRHVLLFFQILTH